MRSLLLLAAGAIVGLAVIMQSQLVWAQGCPPNSSPVSEDDNVVHCECNPGFENQDGVCVPVKEPVKAEPYSPNVIPMPKNEIGPTKWSNEPLENLAQDPTAAKLSELQLEAVEARIARLRKCIELLDYKSNPEWAREMAMLHDEMVKTNSEFLWTGLDLFSLGCVESAKLSEVQLSESIYQDSIWKELQMQEQNLITQAKTASPAEAEALNRTVEAMKRLEDAREARNAPGMAAIIRESISQGKETYERSARVIKDPRVADALYDASAVIGRTSIIFVKGVGGKVAPPAEMAESATHIGLLINQMHEEDQQFKEMSDRSYQRQQKKVELIQKVGELVEERERLKYAVQRSKEK